MKSIKNERGQALIIIALAAIGLFGIAGLAIDGSAKFSDRRHAQNAADTAALAAAQAKMEALYNGDSDVSPTTSSWATCPPPSGVLPSPVCETTQLAGLDRADSNGYDDNPLDEVEVYSPPISGYYQNNEDYVQVIITSRINTTFSRIVGWNELQNTVEAVALAKEGGSLTNGAMIISYDPDPNCSAGGGSGGGSVDVSGNGTLNLYGGGIFLNSDETCGYSAPNCPAINITGGGIISATSVDNIDQACQT
ncbi:MAG TPA: pilus assembly protein TadG-related protein, partial [Anaerolineales bacterium]|nr:pilus assembly protein TadG-related protein [Anaerolineales bacterium]